MRRKRIQNRRGIACCGCLGGYFFDLRSKSLTLSHSCVPMVASGKAEQMRASWLSLNRDFRSEGVIRRY